MCSTFAPSELVFSLLCQKISNRNSSCGYLQKGNNLQRAWGDKFSAWNSSWKWRHRRVLHQCSGYSWLLFTWRTLENNELGLQPTDFIPSKISPLVTYFCQSVCISWGFYRLSKLHHQLGNRNSTYEHEWETKDSDGNTTIHTKKAHKLSHSIREKSFCVYFSFMPCIVYLPRKAALQNCPYIEKYFVCTK